MDEEVVVLPVLLGGSTEVVEEPVEGIGEFVGLVEGERRVVVMTDLVDQPRPGRAAGELETGRIHEVELAQRALERDLIVESCLSRREIRKVTTPDRVRVLCWCPGVDEQVTARPQHPGDLVHELGEIEVVYSIECGHEVR